MKCEFGLSNAITNPTNLKMEPLITYIIAHGCLVVGCWLLTHADNHSIPQPTRYLGSNHISKKQTFGVPTKQLWF